MARPSIDEIAKLSGCSTATVDRVLHGRPGVHSRTRDKVNKALAQLEAEYENKSPQAFRNVIDIPELRNALGLSFKRARPLRSLS